MTDTLPLFTFLTGNPDNLVGGDPASMTDIQGPLYDIRDWLNAQLKPIVDAAVVAATYQSGDLKATASPLNPPAGWLLCDGAEVSRTIYADLFAALTATGGTLPWGPGNGSTTFTLPDLRGRVPVNAGIGTNLSARTVGDHGGEERHSLAVNELAAHKHTVNDPGHNHGNGATGYYNGDHRHGTGAAGWWFMEADRPVMAWSGSSTADSSKNYEQIIASDITKPSIGSEQTTGLNNVTLNHYHSITPASTGISLNDTGNGDTHENMPPFAVVNWIVKT